MGVNEPRIVAVELAAWKIAYEGPEGLTVKAAGYASAEELGRYVAYADRALAEALDARARWDLWEIGAEPVRSVGGDLGREPDPDAREELSWCVREALAARMLARLGAGMAAWEALGDRLEALAVALAEAADR